MAEKNYQIQQKQDNGEVLILHPETVDSIVKSTAIHGSHPIGTPVSTILDDLFEIAATGGVTGVKGSAESTFRKGNVEITKANIGLDKVNNVAITDVQVAQIGTNTNNISANTTAISGINGEITTMKGTISANTTLANQALSLAQGRSRGVSFETVQAMTSALKGASNTEYKIGDTIYIKAVGTSDYWVSGILDTNTGTYGYYELSELETDKVDLTGYQTKNLSAAVNGQNTVEGALLSLDNDLGTLETTVAGHTESISSINGNYNTLSTSITNIINGTTKVGKAGVADSATTATTATTANQLTTARTFQLTGDVTGSASFNGTANAVINSVLSNSGVVAGSYSAVTVDVKGRVTSGGQMIEVGADSQASPSSALAIGGIFFKAI